MPGSILNDRVLLTLLKDTSDSEERSWWEQGEQLAGQGRSPGERKCWSRAAEKISDALLEPSAPLISARQRQGDGSSW